MSSKLEIDYRMKLASRFPRDVKEVNGRELKSYVRLSSVLPYIIGKRGVTLKNIQELSGANIRVPKREDIESASVVVDGEDEEDLVEITIEGIDAAVAKAKEEITKIIDERVLSNMTWLIVDFKEDREAGEYSSRLFPLNCRTKRRQYSRMGRSPRTRHENPHPKSPSVRGPTTTSP